MSLYLIAGYKLTTVLETVFCRKTGIINPEGNDLWILAPTFVFSIGGIQQTPANFNEYLCCSGSQ